jgi:hypothetical protein
MAIQILDNCLFSTEKIDTLWIGSRTTGGTSIQYPIEYTTVSGSTDSIIKIDAWDDINDIVTIGGQAIQVNKIINTGDNIVFTEDLVIDQNGKRYVNTLSFVISNVVLFTNNQIKEFVMTSDGQFALSPTIAFLLDANGNNLVVGYSKPLYLRTNDVVIGDDNSYNFQYSSASYSRARSFQVV